MRFRRRREEPRGEAPGWDAIDAVLAGLYPGQEPVHRGLTLGLAFGAPLQGVSAFRADDHWHYVTYGLSELFEKASDDPARSGWGYELTIRVAHTQEPPAWAFDLLARVADQTQSQGVIYDVGHRIDAGQSISGTPSALTALAITSDPQLGSISTPHGRVDFLQLVGVTAEELGQMKEHSTESVLARMRADNPLLVTDPERLSS